MYHERCLRELQTACEYKNNIILVSKEGARFGETNADFPPNDLINSKLQNQEMCNAFKKVAVTHSNYYYKSFVELLMERVIEGIEASKALKEPVLEAEISSASNKSIQKSPTLGYRKGPSSGRMSRTASAVSFINYVASKPSEARTDDDGNDSDAELGSIYAVLLVSTLCRCTSHTHRCSSHTHSCTSPITFY